MKTRVFKINGSKQIRRYYKDTIAVKRNNGEYIVDIKDEKFLDLCNWQIKKNGFKRNKKYFYASSNGNKILGEWTLHRLIANAKKGELVDHINGNTLDNRRCNLRVVTHSQNAMNKERNFNKKSSKYKGVVIDSGYWSVQITVNGRVYRRRCKSEISAALKYNELALKYHGEYARFNKTEEG